MPTIKLDLIFKEPYETIDSFEAVHTKQGWYYFRALQSLVYYNGKGFISKLDGPAVFKIIEPSTDVLYVTETIFMIDNTKYSYSDYEQHTKVIAKKIDNIIKLVEELDE